MFESTLGVAFILYGTYLLWSRPTLILNTTYNPYQDEEVERIRTKVTKGCCEKEDSTNETEEIGTISHIGSPDRDPDGNYDL